MQSEITVTIKGEDSTFKKKFLEYDVVVVAESDKRLQSIIKNALAEYKGKPDEIIVKIQAIWLNPVAEVS